MTRARKSQHRSPAPKGAAPVVRPHLTYRYPAWMGDEASKGAVVRDVLPIIEGETELHMQEVEALSKYKHMAIAKVLLSRGYLRVDNGANLDVSTWLLGTEAERSAVFFDPRTGYTRNRPTKTTDDTEETTMPEDQPALAAPTAVALSDDSWPLDLAGREAMTVEQLFDLAALMGGTLEIRVRRG